MAETFLHLPRDDRREALAVAAAASGRPVHLLEKDVWVVWALDRLFGAAFREHLVFKGGTSLSKAYRVIRRFSEDVGVTYDIRAIASYLIGNAEEPLPASRSQEKRWTKAIRSRLSAWVSDEVLPVIADALSQESLGARATSEGDKVFIEYEPLAAGSGYVRPAVMVEFGARSTGEPCEVRSIGIGKAPCVTLARGRPWHCALLAMARFAAVLLVTGLPRRLFMATLTLHAKRVARSVRSSPRTF